jgi:hypothetical protein
LAICGINSRRDLDRDAVAAQRFHQFVRTPFLAWRADNEVKRYIG